MVGDLANIDVNVSVPVFVNVVPYDLVVVAQFRLTGAGVECPPPNPCLDPLADLLLWNVQRFGETVS